MHSSIMLADPVQAYILCLLQPLEYIISVFLNIFYNHIVLRLLMLVYHSFAIKVFVQKNNVVALVNIFFFNSKLILK